MNLPKFPHSAMFVGATNVRKTEYLLRILETVYKTISNSSSLCVQRFGMVIKHIFLGSGFR